MRRVVITGIGAVTPVGKDAPSTWESICAGRHGITKIDRFDTEDLGVSVAALVKDFDPSSILDRKEQRRTDPYCQYALYAADEALRDCGSNLKDLDPYRVGVIIGSGIGGMQTLEENHQKFLEKGPGRVSVFFIPMMISNMAAGNISIRTGFKGVNFAPVTACAPAGPEGAAKIAAIMGMAAPSGDKMVAHVLCNGGCNAKDNFEYRGVTDCLAATKVCGGNSKACRYGCFGFGSCVAACKFDAIHVENGVAVVDKEKCTNCGACREACPHHLIVEVPYKQKVFVNCSNKDKGPAVTKVCANSCIACGMCERTCKFDAIHVVNNVAVIDYSKCKNCTMCAKACPRNAIEPIPTPEEKEKFKAAQKAAAEKKAAAAKAAAEAAKAAEPEAPKAE